jgi:hypothetical protein
VDGGEINAYRISVKKDIPMGHPERAKEWWNCQFVIKLGEYE